MADDVRRPNDWYKDCVFYQVWPRSFLDTNADGIGDLNGIVSKLDYLKNLGVGALWISPFFLTPNVDWGYDVADYCAVDPDYGTMDDCRRLVDGAHDRGMRVVFDLVLNHTSTEHAWFQESRRDPQGPYGDFYIWRDPSGFSEDGTPLPPNNWDSLFTGSAWTYDETRGQFYLHLFAPEQADLNYENPAVVSSLADIIRFWLDFGVDGFRFDAVNCIGKAPGLPNDTSDDPVRGRCYYKDWPTMYDYLRTLRAAVCENPSAIVIGEAAEATPQTALLYASDEAEQKGSRIYDLIFTFEHMGADCGVDDYDPRPFDLALFKGSLCRWQHELAGRSWNALYLENHDHPRSIDRFGSAEARDVSAKMLAACYLFLQGTPFVYQGQEIGMTGVRLASIDDYRDVATKQNYLNLAGKMSEKAALEIIHRGSREAARTPMQWEPGANAGFSQTEPWFAPNQNYPTCNVLDEQDDPNSVLSFYRAAIALRSRLAAVRHGDFAELAHESDKVFAYLRTTKDEQLLVICSFSHDPESFTLPKDFAQAPSCHPVLCNYPDAPLECGTFVTRPFETRVYLLEG